MSSKDILVPNIGDFKDVEVIEVLVKAGQKIKKNDSLITIESDKSSVEVPSTSDGVIEKINMKIGDKVSEGDLILTVDKESKTDVKVQPLQKNKVRNSIILKISLNSNGDRISYEFIKGKNNKSPSRILDQSSLGVIFIPSRACCLASLGS